jgi:hypothetical protein
MIKKTDHLEKIVPGVLNSFCQVAGSGSHPVQIHYKKGTFLPVMWILF